MDSCPYCDGKKTPVACEECKNLAWDNGRAKGFLEASQIWHKKLEASELQVSELRKVLEKIVKDTEDTRTEHWWFDCPDRGGVDFEAIEKALAEYTDSRFEEPKLPPNSCGVWVGGMGPCVAPKPCKIHG